MSYEITNSPSYKQHTSQWIQKCKLSSFEHQHRNIKQRHNNTERSHGKAHDAREDLLESRHLRTPAIVIVIVEPWIGCWRSRSWRWSRRTAKTRHFERQLEARRLAILVHQHVLVKIVLEVGHDSREIIKHFLVTMNCFVFVSLSE